MALVRHRQGNAALAAAATAIIGRYGRQLGRAAYQGLQEAIYEGAIIGREEIQRQLSNWIQEFGNELGNGAVQIARQVQNAANTALQRGGELWEAIQNYNNNELQLQEVNIDDVLDYLENQGSQDNQLTNTQDNQLTNTQDNQLAMEESNEPMEQARMAQTTTGANSVSKETPISRYPSLTYGLQETHTTIIPWRTWFSVGYLDHADPVRAEFRLNAIWDMMITTITAITAGSSIGAKGLYNRPVGPAGATQANADFPLVPTTGAHTAERPQWRDYWKEYYDYYTVLGCEYEITIKASGNNRGADIMVGTTLDSYSDTATSTGNVFPPLTPLYQAMAYKGMKWTTICGDNSEEDNGPSTKVIKGRYAPGMIKRNIVNDGDVKTWTKTDGSSPTLKDTLVLNFWKAPLNYSTPTQTCANVMVELKYIVQFKDLKLQARYPTTTITDQTITTYLGGNNDDIIYTN